jgi:hypothetical protein
VLVEIASQSWVFVEVRTRQVLPGLAARIKSVRRSVLGSGLSVCH